MNLNNFFRFFTRKENSNETKTEVNYDELIREMKIAKMKNDMVREEIFKKAEEFDKSMKEIKKKSRK